MQIAFFSRNKDLLELSASLSEASCNFWFEKGLPDLVANLQPPGIIFIDYDDPNFKLEEFFGIINENLVSKKLFLKVLISSGLSVGAFKKLQDSNNLIDGLIRAPIKLKDIASFVEDYRLVLNEIKDDMGEPVKKQVADPVNTKIQKRFDLIFSIPEAFDEDSDDNFNSTNIDNDDFLFNEDNSMSDNAHKKEIQKDSSLKLDLESDDGGIDFELETNSSSSSSSLDSESDSGGKKPKEIKSEAPPKLGLISDDTDLEFSLDFQEDSSETPEAPSSLESGSKKSIEENTVPDHLSFDYTESDKEMDDILAQAIQDSSNQLSEGTQKTVLFDRNKFQESTASDLDTTEDLNNELDLMSPEEENLNIESTINNILRPKALDSTQEFDISGMQEGDELQSFSIEEDVPTMSSFDIDSVEFSDEDDTKKDLQESVLAKEEQNLEDIDLTEDSNSKMPEATHENMQMNSTGHEDFNRIQATIRQLREEREELLGQIKNYKAANRELEQDNLTLKACLDESKIEVSILRKRHLTELEDFKYQFSANEEKKQQAIEKARQADGKREKLEQRVRIDFNQVKQREKELETKLELLTIDIESQVQSRDQKILELRRKIDSLEFNMENVSIKEHKSEEDKRKLEDKLNKIMKTLRHSIKNLEDDIDQASDDTQDLRQNSSIRSGKV